MKHPWHAWGDTNSEEHPKTNSSPTLINVPICFGNISNLICVPPAPILFSPASTAQPMALPRCCQQLCRAPAPSTTASPPCFQALSATSVKKQQKKAQNTALCNSYTKTSPSKMQIGGILVAIIQANQEVLLVLRKGTQQRRFLR